MKSMIRVGALVLSLLMIVCAFASCGEIKSTAEEARVVGKVGDFEVRYEELRYLVLTHKAELAAKYGEDIFLTPESGAAYADELEGMVEASLRESYAVLSVCDGMDIKTSDKTTKKEVNAEVKALIDSFGGKDEYVEYLGAAYMTDAVYRLYTGIVSCQYRYFEEIFSEKEKEAYDAVLAHDGIVHTMSIFVKNDEGERVADNRKAAEHVRDSVKGGKSLESFIGTKYNQDMSSCEYYFSRGYMEKSYEEAAFALKVGEVSDVVETKDGFYVIQRLEVEDDYVQNHLEELIEKWILGDMNESFDECEETLSFEKNDYGKTLDYLAIS